MRDGKNEILLYEFLGHMTSKNYNAHKYLNVRLVKDTKKIKRQFESLKTVSSQLFNLNKNEDCNLREIINPL